jgi:isoquinoline 1-oxidoreductase alpha subunit
MIKLNINGAEYRLDIDPDMPLLWAIRDHAGLTGTKYGCGMALCGACTVHLNGKVVRSCITTVAEAEGKQVTTIEGLDSAAGAAVKAAWQKLEVVQCGYCQSGQIMAATELLTWKPSPSDSDINAAMSGNLCRCGTYARIHAAIKAASRTLG